MAQRNEKDDWQAGDLALCVDTFAGVFPPIPFMLRLGAVYEVSSVECSADAEMHTGSPVILGLCEDPNHAGWAWSEINFTKIKPLTDEERDEELAQLKRDEGVVIYPFANPPRVEWRA